MPLSELTTLFGGISMLASWFFIGQRIKQADGAVPVQVRLLHTFFLYMAVFFLFMFAPDLTLNYAPSDFPLLMAWGYVVGHVFAYLAFLNVARLMFSLLPRLERYVKPMLVFGGICAAALTVVNFITMVNGQHPVFDSAKHVILFHTAPAVGAGIAIFAALSVFPTAILMIINGVHNPEARIRSFLLGAGLFLLMASGPIHDNAKTWQLYVVADILSMISLLVLATGVAYRLRERIGPAPSLARPIAAGMK